MTKFLEVVEEAFADLVSQVDFINLDMQPKEVFDELQQRGYRLQRLLVTPDKEEFLCLIEEGMAGEQDEIALVTYIFTENDEIKYIRATKEDVYNGIKRSEA